MDPSLNLIVGAVVLAVLVLAYLRWHKGINYGFTHAYRAVISFLKDSRTCRVAETFLNEAAVLWFVFPILDTIYEHKKLTDPILRQAYFAALIFFIGAVVLSHAGNESRGGSKEE